MKIAVVTDSTSYIPKDITEKLNIRIIPLSVNFGDESFREDIDLTTEQFYEKLNTSEALPTTSQPAIGAFIELFEKLEQNYDAVFSIHLSSKLSGTYSAAKSASNMMEDLDVYLYDSELSAMPQGFYAIRAAELARDGAGPQTILKELDEMKERTKAYFMVDDLSHLKRGGRLSSAGALLGSLLSIKPVLHIVEGEIQPFEKIRTKRRALHRIYSMLEEDSKADIVKRAVFIHGNREEEALRMKETFEENFPKVETMISHFGPVVGTHLGEGALGISWYTT